MKKSPLWFILVTVLFLLLRVVYVGNDITNSDAGRWHRRSQNFLDSLKQHDFKSTYQRYHPGVSLMWIGAVVKQIDLKIQLKNTTIPNTLENADYFPILHGQFKIAIAVVLTLLLIFQLFFINKLYGSGVSLIYGILISIEPYFLGINRWVHLSSLEVFFVFTSLLSLLYWRENDKKIFLILSSMLFAVGLLTKITAIIIAPLFFLIFVKKFLDSKNLKKCILDILVFMLVLFLTVFALFPALWVDAGYVFNKMIEPITLAVTDNDRSDSIPAYIQPFYYVIVLLFKLSPITLLLFILSLVTLKKTKEIKIVFILLSLFFYFIFLSFGEQKIDRYIISFIPYIILLSSIVIEKFKFSLKIFSITLSILFFIYTLFVYGFTFSSYYSPLFGGTKSALKLRIYDNSGEYFSDAARYLNEKGRDVYTWVPAGYESFFYYYKGNIQREFNENINYKVTSYDEDRSFLINDKCFDIEKTFGNKDSEVVVVLKCN